MYKTREVRVCSTDYEKVDRDFETKCNKIRKKKGSTNDETIFFLLQFEGRGKII